MKRFRFSPEYPGLAAGVYVLSSSYSRLRRVLPFSFATRLYFYYVIRPRVPIQICIPISYYLRNVPRANRSGINTYGNKFFVPFYLLIIGCVSLMYVFLLYVRRILYTLTRRDTLRCFFRFFFFLDSSSSF